MLAEGMAFNLATELLTVTSLWNFMVIGRYNHPSLLVVSCGQINHMYGTPSFFLS